MSVLDPVLLHVEMLPNEKMNFTLKGEPLLVVKMISTAMHNNVDIAADIIACVAEYCKSQGFDLGDLSKIVEGK